ncbi:MAG: hypothetical protein ACR2LE_02635 [Nocardioidaceae bacterium]
MPAELATLLHKESLAFLNSYAAILSRAARRSRHGLTDAHLAAAVGEAAPPETP